MFTMGYRICPSHTDMSILTCHSFFLRRSQNEPLFSSHAEFRAEYHRTSRCGVCLKMWGLPRQRWPFFPVPSLVLGPPAMLNMGLSMAVPLIHLRLGFPPNHPANLGYPHDELETPLNVKNFRICFMSCSGTKKSLLALGAGKESNPLQLLPSWALASRGLRDALRDTWILGSYDSSAKQVEKVRFAKCSDLI